MISTRPRSVTQLLADMLTSTVKLTHHHVADALRLTPRQRARFFDTGLSGGVLTQRQVRAVREIARVKPWLPYDCAVFSAPPPSWRLTFNGSDEHGRVHTCVVVIDMSVWADIRQQPSVIWHSPDTHSSGSPETHPNSEEAV